ncbi:MAG: hypothetical protein HGGPFJEG_00286 [Ignavibacteria bacterium]|nr:hypothetical protein [Ignavibacteria bacterium]
MLKKILIFTGSLVALFFLFNNVIMPIYVKHSDTVKVPKIIGMNIIEAKKILEDGGLEIKQADVKFDESKPIGQILDQNPPPEEKVKYGRRVYVTVCGGEQLAEVPNLKGKSIRDAKFTLEQRGLKIGETVRKNSNEFPEDFVLSQIIQPGSKIKRNSTIDLIISDGSIIGDLKVPSLVGKNLEDAKKTITASNLKLGKITYQTNNNLPPGQIIDQYPKADKSANQNTQVDLFVARKKEVVKIETEEADTDEESGNKNKSDINNKGTEETTKKPEIKKDNSEQIKKDKPGETPTEKSTDIKKQEQNTKKNAIPSDKTKSGDEKPKDKNPKN